MRFFPLYTMWKRLFLSCLWLAGITVFAFTPDSISLLFVGDLMQHQPQIAAAKGAGGKYDYSDCFKHLANEIGKADLAIGNLEVTLGGKPYSGYPAFSAPDEFAESARNAGFDVLLTANNHCLDRGKKGLVRTLDILDSLRIIHTGTFRTNEERQAHYPLLIEKKGFRIVLLNYTYGTNGIAVSSPNVVNFIEEKHIYRDILKARLMRPDVIIACMHWGIEYNMLPEKYVRDLAKRMIGLGVDHVIGSHPHVIQPIEVWDDEATPDRHVVAYSLGNFISNMSRRNTDGGLLLKISLRKTAGITRLDKCSYAFVWTSRPVLSGKKNFEIYPSTYNSDTMRDIEKRKFFDYLALSRVFFRTYTKGIEEFFFDRKTSETFVELK